MLEHFTTNTDQVFDQLIYQEKYPTVPVSQYFLHSALLQQPQKARKNGKEIEQQYSSPFRSKLTPEEAECSNELKLQKYSHSLEYPEFLTFMDQIQTQEMNQLKLNEKKLAYYKSSQNIIKYDKDNYQYIKEPIDLDTVPKVPYFTYKKTKAKPPGLKQTKILTKGSKGHKKTGENLWATPENKEDIIIYKGRFYSKPVFDNAQLDQLKHNEFIAQKKKETRDKKTKLSQDYNSKFNQIDDQINSNKVEMSDMQMKQKKLEQFYENNLTKKYFENIALFNKRKTNKLSQIAHLKTVIAENPLNDNDNDRDSFEYETVEEVKYI